MTVAQQTPPKTPPVESRTTQHNGRWSGFRHLLKARLLELKREREVIFWAVRVSRASGHWTGHRLRPQVG